MKKATKKKEQEQEKRRKQLLNRILYILIIIVAVLGGAGLDVIIRPNTEVSVEKVIDTGGSIEFSSEQVPAEVETEDGETEILDVPTVEAVDSANITDLTECGDEEECGLGSYIYAPTDSIENFKNYTLGKCFNTDGAYGAQCWDLADLFWQNYAGRRFSTCGTGVAKGAVNDGCWQINAQDDFYYTTLTSEIIPGSVLVFNNGYTGHVAFALGYPHDGYVAVLGQNQGGGRCDGGGSSTNIINISLKYFAGAFTPKSYVKTTEENKTNTSGDQIKYAYKEGDYFSKVLVELGLDEGNLWGEDGTVNYYTKQLIDQNMLEYGNTGNVKWSEEGIEFTLTRR